MHFLVHVPPEAVSTSGVEVAALPEVVLMATEVVTMVSEVAPVATGVSTTMHSHLNAKHLHLAMMAICNQSVEVEVLGIEVGVHCCNHTCGHRSHLYCH